MQAITSVQNPRIKQVAKLQTESRTRRESGLFCVERARELERAIDAGFVVVEFYIWPERFKELPLLERIQERGADIVEVNEAVLAKIAYQENPQGFVAVMHARTTELAAIPATGLFLVCSGLEKPGNVGAILRSADAAGAAGVLIDAAGFDLFNPNCVRASTGAVFSMPIVCGGREEILQWLKVNKVRLIAATPGGAARYSEADLRGDVAIVVGAEAQGLAPQWIDAADIAVSIPMRGTADSLNVSVTAALLLFEAVRQRESK